MDVTLDTLIFQEEELDFESDAGMPVILSGIAAPQVFDSYLITGSGQELKLYRAYPNNIAMTWDVKLLVTRDKFLLIQNLIKKQTDLVKDYRKDHSKSGELKGFTFKANPIDTRVWLNSFTNSGSFYSTSRAKELIRCKLSVTEAE
jgi:hypothetical protein